MRRLVATCAVALALVSAGDAWARTETPPQHFHPGTVVKLRAIGIDLKLPESADGWTLSVAVEGTEAWDILRRLDPSRGELVIELSRPHADDCAALARALEGKKLPRVAASPLAPPSFEPWAIEVAPGVHRVCTNTFEGPYTADISGTALDPNEIVPVLAEVARMVFGHRGGSAPPTKAPKVALVGRVQLAASGVRAEIPRGWSVRVSTSSDGRKLDLLERLEPGDPPLRLTVERRIARCAAVMPAGAKKTGAPYLPDGFGPESIESAQKQGQTATFCMELGADAVVVEIGSAGPLTPEEARVVRSILAPAAAAKSGVGTSLSSDADVDEGGDDLEIGARAHGVAAFDILAFSARDESNRPFGVGASFDAWSSTARRGLGFAVEVGGSGGVGTNKLLTWDVHGGIGAALTYGRFAGLLTIGGGADGFHGVRNEANETFFEAPAAGYLHVAPRLVIPLGKKLALDVRGAYHRRFDFDVGRELRGQLGVAYGPIWLGLRVTRWDDRATLGDLVLGFQF